jgi:hypothetical protein
MPSLLHPMISAGGRDFSTCLPMSPLSSTQGKDLPWAPGQTHPGASRSGYALPTLGPREVAALGAWHKGT